LGALAELHTDLQEDYPNLPVDQAKVMLYEHAAHLLAPFAPKLQTYAQRALQERGVEIHTGTGVSQIGPTRIELSTGDTVNTHTLVWAAGLQANPIVNSLGIELVHGSRIPVGADLQVQDHPGVFAIATLRPCRRQNRAILPGLGATALRRTSRQATIQRLLDGKHPEPFEFFHKGIMAQVGRGAAVVQLPTGGTMTGHLAWLAWLGVHLALLNGAEEKLSTFVDWGWSLLTHKRGKRIILSDEDVASTQPE
jgi:NADH dehydrogenase